MRESADALRCEFLEKHQAAHYIVYDSRTRFPIGAIYYAPDYFTTPEVRKVGLRRFEEVSATSAKGEVIKLANKRNLSLVRFGRPTTYLDKRRGLRSFPRTTAALARIRHSASRILVSGLVLPALMLPSLLLAQVPPRLGVVGQREE